MKVKETTEKDKKKTKLNEKEKKTQKVKNKF